MCRRAQVQSGMMNYGRQTSASSSIVSTSSLPHQRSTEQVDYTPGTKFNELEPGRLTTHRWFKS